MTKKMLIDATHKEEIRVAITDGNKLVEYDYESQSRKPIKGSIFLAKVTRVEPSLQAAFVSFGGNRHGFLPFSEIHPDYFRIPVADKEALLAEQEALIQEHDKEEEALDEEIVAEETETEEVEESKSEDSKEEEIPEPVVEDVSNSDDEPKKDDDNSDSKAENNADSSDGGSSDDSSSDDNSENDNKNPRRRNNGRYRGRGNKRSQYRNRNVEVVGGEEIDGEQRFRFNLRRKYKIQEVIKRGQIMLVQANKEERGNKGAAVGSYLSLPGRYCVLMPNSPRAGGVSRKIANNKDRARMREIVKELEVPKGMSVIVRTAGVARTKAEIKRDLDYLMRLWDNIRELTMQSTAPALVYEEADLIKRSVRDLYTSDVEEIYVAGEEGFKTAKEFMKMMIPSHVKKVKFYDGKKLPLFNRYQLEGQINEIGQPEVRLKSGGYLVINPTEALVSVDVNSGKATKGRHIEETALKTNLESADEVARQLRLRDLGGLVVIDFIDMENRGNNAKVERRMKDALSTDRARVQVGRISSFGLMELSRQRLSPSLIEAQFEKCNNCSGIGLIRTADAMSILVLRAIEEEGIRGRSAQIIVHVTGNVALYILNHKRKKMAQIEEKYNLEVLIRVNDEIAASDYNLEVSKPVEKITSNDSDLEEKIVENTEKDKSEDKSEDKNDDRPRRRTRRPRNNKENESGTGNNGNVKEQPPSSIPDIDGNVAKPVKDDSKVTKKKPPVRKPKKSQSNDSSKVANDDVNTEKKEPAKKEVETQPSEASTHEVVNQAPKQKKKGWWNRL